MNSYLRKALRAFAMIALWAGAASLSQADVVLYSTLGPQKSWDRHDAYVVLGPNGAGSPRPYAAAMPFMLDNSAVLKSIHLPIGAGLIPSTNLFIVELLADNDGLPGDVIESFSFADLPFTFSATEPLSVAKSQVQPILEAGTVYWLAVLPGGDDTAGGWNFTSPLQTGTIAFTRDGGNTWTLKSQADTAIAAFRLHGHLLDGGPGE
jgi:hypothetical protein